MRFSRSYDITFTFLKIRHSNYCNAGVYIKYTFKKALTDLFSPTTFIIFTTKVKRSDTYRLIILFYLTQLGMYKEGIL